MLAPILRSIAVLSVLCSLALPCAARAQNAADPFHSAFAPGREYFILRSGTARMIIETNTHGVRPAVTWLLFDATTSCQTLRKERAYNHEKERACETSALEVLIGGMPFTALPHNTVAGWVTDGGVPGVEARWWAGGVAVTEKLTAVDSTGTFLRTITLRGADLAGPETLRVRLALPAGRTFSATPALAVLVRNAAFGVALAGADPCTVDDVNGTITTGPIRLVPGGAVTLRSAVVVQIPAPGYAHYPTCTPPDTGWAPAAGVLQAGMQELLRRTAGAVRTDQGGLLASTRAAWGRTSTITAPDSMLTRLYDNARYTLPGSVGPNGKMDAGIFEYGAQWVRDGSNVAVGLLHAGHFESARALLSYIVMELVSPQGTTIIADGYDDPDREEFDQMGELMHALKAYRDWTGDTMLIVGARERLLAMIERPMHPSFRDGTGMVHNRREFWERTFDDGYELAYQTYMVQGLRDAADLAGALGAADRAASWRAEADTFLHAMLRHPTHALVENGTLIKRRNVDGSVAHFIPGFARKPGRDDPRSTESFHRLNPDASTTIPIFLRVVDPRSAVARNTLDALEGLWNARWFGGGYERYHSSSQQDQPGPWCFATAFLARAQHDAGLYDRSRRSLAWLFTVQGGNAGAWFEEIPVIRSQIPTAGIVVWTSAEIPLFMVRHWLGIGFTGRDLVIRPNLFPGDRDARADLRFRTGRIRLAVDQAGPVAFAHVNGTRFLPGPDGSIVIPSAMVRDNMDIRITARP